MVPGDQSSKNEDFENLVRQHQKAIFGLCLNILGTEEDANEATQIAFVKAYRGFESFGGRSTVRTWLYRIAINCSKTLLRQKVKNRNRQLDSDIGQVQIPVEAVVNEQIEKQEERKQILAAIDHLPEKQRLVLSLRIFEELPFKEIGKLLNMREGSAKTNYHYAVETLKVKLGEGTNHD